jgi:uncharacterized membrane protein YgdD (TMEM256/DUF423 family)
LQYLAFKHRVKNLMTPQFTIFLGSFFGFLSVALGAFGAHGLKDKLSPDMLVIYHTATQYMTTHALALIAVGVLAKVFNQSLSIASLSFLGGILIFSGSLYALSFTEIKILGAITPIGGVLFLVGWISLAWNFYKGATNS